MDTKGHVMEGHYSHLVPLALTSSVFQGALKGPVGSL